MARIFLSYARADADCAKKLADLIARSGHDVWWDRELHGGSHFTTEIDKALRTAEAVVVLWSNASLESAWVQDEAAEGRDSHRLVPVVIDAVRPPLGFRQYQAIDLTDLRNGDHPKQLEELLRAIIKMGAPNEQKPSREAPAAREEPAQKHSICVLPFMNMSGDPEQEYFSDGITEDIITDLSKVSALSVVARNTAFAFKGHTVDVKEVARTVDVSHVLEGSVRKAGNRVRITAQLIDGAKGDHVWADRYDRDLTDIFAIQDEISKAIVAALRVKLLPQEKKEIERRGTESPEAYSLYLMGRQQWIGGTWGNNRRDEAIVRLATQAVNLDPHYAEAWALMALAQAELRFWHGLDVDPIPAAERALEINPGLAEPHCVKVRNFEQQGRQEDADKELEVALRLGPDSWEVNREAARLMFRRSRMKDAIRYFEKSAQLMDIDFHSCAMLITCYIGVGDEEAALGAAKRTLERAEAAVAKDPTNGSALAAGATSLMMLGNAERGKDWIKRALLLDPDNKNVLYNVACGLTFRNSDLEGALDLLEEYFAKVDAPAYVHHAEVDPDMEPLRDHPRFQHMMESAKQRLGIAKAPVA